MIEFMFQSEHNRLSQALEGAQKKHSKEIVKVLKNAKSQTGALEKQHNSDLETINALQNERDDLKQQITTKTSELEQSNQVSVCNEHKIYFISTVYIKQLNGIRASVKQKDKELKDAQVAVSNQFCYGSFIALYAG